MITITNVSSICAEESNQQTTLNLYARSAALMDADTKRLLYEKEAQMCLPMASTTKIMTLILALEMGNPTDEITFSKHAASMPKVHLGAKEGQQFYLRDLCYALMLESYNDCAVAIAEAIGGDCDHFADMMNEKAKEIGMLHTNFVTPNGLDDSAHYSTAYDMCLLGTYVIQMENAMEIIKTKSYSFSSIDQSKSYTISNKDLFLTNYDGAIGIKTGYTGNAGYCFVGAAKKGDETLVSCVLGSGWPPNKNDKWKDTYALMNYGFEHYEKKIVVDDAAIQQVLLCDGMELDHKDHFRLNELKEEKYVLVAPENEYAYLLSEEDEVEFTYELPEELYAPVNQNEKIGYMILTINHNFVEKIPLYSKNQYAKITYWFILKYLAKKMILQ